MDRYHEPVTTPGRTPPRDGGANLFTPVSSGRISELIVEQVRGLIRSGQLGPGDRLPSERELCKQFGVSRVTVRDALRLLEGAGLVDSRVGARGGAFVRVPSGLQIGQGIADMVTMSALDAEEITEARMVVELAIAPLVCERADEQDIHEMEEICRRADKVLAEGSYDAHASADFHVRFVQSAHNRALDLLVESFRGPLLTSLEMAKVVAPIMGQRGVKEHRAIIEAVADRDAERVTTILAAHLGRTARRVRAKTASRQPTKPQPTKPQPTKPQPTKRQPTKRQPTKRQPTTRRT